MLIAPKRLKIRSSNLAVIVINMYKRTVVIKILQGSAVTQTNETMLGGLTIYPPVAHFLWCMCAKNYENWLAATKVMAKISRLTFLAHPVVRMVKERRREDFA